MDVFHFLFFEELLEVAAHDGDGFGFVLGDQGCTGFFKRYWQR